MAIRWKYNLQQDENIIHGKISGKLKCNLLEGKNTSFEENFGKDENTNMAKYNLWQVEKQPVRGRKYNLWQDRNTIGKGGEIQRNGDWMQQGGGLLSQTYRR